MKPSRPAALAAIVAVVLLAPATALAARELVRDGGASVTIGDGAGCEPAAQVTVHGDTPDIFQAGSGRMQRLVDATQAVLRYECETLDALHVTGRLGGVGEPVYDGVANAVDGWVLEARRSISAKDAGVDASPAAAAAEPADRVISVASIKLDMDVDLVRRNVGEVFGAEPVYDASSGTLHLNRPGCPVDATPPDAGADYRRPGANCVTAWFTDRRLATLYRFRYTQSANGSMDEVRKVLVENFGEPHADAWNEDGEYRSLLWTAPGGAATPTESLEARLFRDGGATVIDIVLADPRLAGDGAGASPASAETEGGVELKL